MKIGMLSGLWFVAEEASVLTAIQRASALGFHYIDLHGVFHAGPKHLDAAQRLAVKEALRQTGLTVRNYVLHAPHNIPSASPAQRDENLAYLQEGIDMAVGWGVNQLMLNAGQWDYAVSRQDAWQRAVGFLRQVCDYAWSKNVFIAQEPEPYVWFLVNDIETTQRMAADVNRPNFTALVDLGHMALCREQPDVLRRLEGSIIHAHFSDHQPQRHTNQVIGSGFTRTRDYLDWLDHAQIDRQMERFGYDELVVSFELGAPGDEIGNPDEWVTASLRHIQEIAPYMSI